MPRQEDTQYKWRWVDKTEPVVTQFKLDQKLLSTGKQNNRATLNNNNIMNLIIT